MYEVHGEGAFSCDEHCGREFMTKQILKTHLANVYAREKLCMSKLFLFDEESKSQDCNTMEQHTNEDNQFDIKDS